MRRRVAGAAPATDRFDRSLHHPHAFEEQRGRHLRREHAAAIGDAEHRLHPVRQAHHRFDADHGREPLDGVERTEGVAHLARGPTRWASASRLVDGEQLGARRRQVLVDLGQVGAEELAEIELLDSAATTAWLAHDRRLMVRSAAADRGPRTAASPARTAW